MPGSRLEIFLARATSHLDDPERFADVVLDFLQTARPVRIDAKQLRARLRAGAAAPA
jgi:hypothetical protein